MKLNRNFGKLENETLTYAPAILKVVTHHHDEWDEPVFDPETGDPVIDPETGEQATEHKTRDWDTTENKLHPTAADYRQMGYIPVYNSPYPSTPAKEGYHWEFKRWIQQGVEGYEVWTREFAEVADPMPTLTDYDTAMEEHLKQERSERGYTTREPDAYLTSEVPRWSQDAHDWVAHRDAVMEYALALINAVESGERQPPTMAEFKAGLPVINWTYQEDESSSEG